MKLIERLQIKKYGIYWKLPYFTLFSMIPFFLLYEETLWFWIPYFIAFFLAVKTSKIFTSICVPILFSIGVIVSWVHHQTIAPIDLLFFGRLLLFIQLGFLLMEIHRQRTVVVYFLNFVLMLVAGALTFRFWFALYSLVFFFCLGYLFLELSFQRFHAEVKSRFKLWYTAKLVGFLLLCGYSLFLFIPRVHFDQIPSQLGLAISGFSDQVSLDDITRILESDKVVMRVKTRGSPGYYKGVVLDYFDGRNWQKSSKFYPLRSSLKQNYGLKVPAKYHERFTEVQEFEFQVLPSKNKYLFLPPYIRSLEIDPPFLDVSPEGDVRRKFNLRRSQEYKAYAYVFKRSKSLLKTEPPIERSIASRYLQLPNVSPRVQKLARYITRDQLTYFEKIKAIRAFFDKSFRYSLESHHPGDPIEDFLLNNRVGHCQYYAAAMVLLLRLNGIPSRMVNGFTSGEYNEYGDYWTIRMKDAHAWVEVYGGNGIWVTEDPTPAQRGSWFQSGIFQSTFQQLNKIGEYFDALWQSSVLYFSRVDQNIFFMTIFLWWQKSPILHSLLIGFGFLLILLLILRFFSSFEMRRDSCSEWARRIDKWLKKNGVERHPSQGLKELLEERNFQQKTHQILSQIQEKIYRLEFQQDVDAQKLQMELKILWKELRASSD